MGHHADNFIVKLKPGETNVKMYLTTGAEVPRWDSGWWDEEILKQRQVFLWKEEQDWRMDGHTLSDTKSLKKKTHLFMLSNTLLSFL